jgi:2',3'-cyclic-nucleotide 2'-phosphodiesterase (5'-nucleotidase family)
MDCVHAEQRECAFYRKPLKASRGFDTTHTVRGAVLTQVCSLFACIVLLCASAGGAVAGNHTLTLLFTSDHHGQVLPLQEPRPGNIVGGVTRRHTLIEQIREEVGADKVILVDAGDLFYGTTFSEMTRGGIDCAAYQLMGYDAITFGNHDFDHGRYALQDYIHKYRTPWISATFIDTKSWRPFVSPYVIKSVKDLRVAIIGFTGESAFKPEERLRARGLAIASPDASAEGVHALLRQEADVFIAITHQGVAADRAFAVRFPYFHVVIGGHDHRALHQALVEKNATGDLVGPIIGHAGCRGMYLGRLDFTVSGTRKEGYRVTRYDYRLLPVTADICESAEMASLIAQIGRGIDPEQGIGRERY